MLLPLWYGWTWVEPVQPPEFRGTKPLLATPSQAPSELKGKEAMVDLDPMNDCLEARFDHTTSDGVNSRSGLEEASFGPCMPVSRHRGRGGSRVGSGGVADSPISRVVHAGTSESSNGTPNALPRSRHIHSTHGRFSSRGRGGHLGNRSRTSGPSSDQAAGITNDMTFSPSRDMETITGVGFLVPRNSGLSIMPDLGTSSKPLVSPKEKLLHSYPTSDPPPTLRLSEE